MPKPKNRSSSDNTKDANVQRVKVAAEIADDPLLALIGTGKHLWADEHADDYVNRLRENWDSNDENPQQPGLAKERNVNVRRNIRRGRSGRGGR